MMKRTIIAFILGAALATASSVYAEEVTTLIGRTIEGEFPVKVNGEALDKTAIVIDGTSYLPVRAIGEALNMEIKFDADLGIELYAKEAAKLESAAPIEMSVDDADAIRTSEEQIQISQSKIVELRARIAELDKKISETQDPIEIEMWTNQKKSAEQLLQANEENIVSQQAYIEKIKAKYATP